LSKRRAVFPDRAELPWQPGHIVRIAPEPLAMSLLVRIYYNAVFGGLGGLLGWMLFGIFGSRNPEGTLERELNNLLGIHIGGLDQKVQMIVGGTLIGGFIGYLIVSVDALRDGAVVRFARLGTYGVLLGALGGAIGMFLGDEVNYFLIRALGNNAFAAMLARGLGWTVLGMTIGMCEGIAAKSMGKFSYGTLGGTIGGFLGGSLFGLLYYLSVQTQQQGASYWANAIGLVILGASIGSLSALVQGVFQPASVKVLRGWQEGREYPLDRAATLLGRDEHADIALFRDMKVEKKHAYIKRIGEQYFLVNNGAPSQFTLVNEMPVTQQLELHDGDRIQLGNVLLRFQTREAVNRPRVPRPLPSAPLPTALADKVQR
jgi:hypothetical protein